MKYYVDIKAFSMDLQEIGEHPVMSELFQQVHSGIGQHENGDVAVSFPFYDGRKKSLGGTIRLHGSKEALEHTLSLVNLNTYALVGQVAFIPEEYSAVIVKRVRYVDNAQLRRLQKRAEQRGEIRELGELTKPLPEAPRLCVKTSSGRIIKHFLIKQEKAKLDQIPKEFGKEDFSLYGLSSQNAVPFF